MNEGNVTWLLTVIILAATFALVTDNALKNSLAIERTRRNADPELCEVWHKHANQRADAAEERLRRLEGIASMTLGVRVVAEELK